MTRQPIADRERRRAEQCRHVARRMSCLTEIVRVEVALGITIGSFGARVAQTQRLAEVRAVIGSVARA